MTHQSHERARLGGSVLRISLEDVSPSQRVPWAHTCVRERYKTDMTGPHGRIGTTVNFWSRNVLYASLSHSARGTFSTTFVTPRVVYYFLRAVQVSMMDKGGIVP